MNVVRLLEQLEIRSQSTPIDAQRVPSRARASGVFGQEFTQRSSLITHDAVQHRLDDAVILIVSEQQYSRCRGVIYSHVGVDLVET